MVWLRLLWITGSIMVGALIVARAAKRDGRSNLAVFAYGSATYAILLLATISTANSLGWTR